MRRLSRTLVAAAVVAPLTATALSSPASAAGSSLTVTTIGREGAKVAATGQLENLSTWQTFTFTSGRAVSLPAGRYAVVVDIWNQKDQTDTLGARIVTVSGAASTVIDARAGHPLAVSLDHPPAGSWHRDDARLCVADSPATAEAVNDAGKVYVIPTASSSLQFAYDSQWSPQQMGPGGTAAGDVYAVSGMTTGVPAGPTYRYQRSTLANIAVQGRKGPNGSDTAMFMLQPQSTTTDCQTDLAGPTVYETTPYSVTAHVNAANWGVRSDESAAAGDIGSFESKRRVAAGGSYVQIFDRATWGPIGSQPSTWYGRLDFGPQMFADPSTPGEEAAAKYSGSLYKGGTLVSAHSWTDMGPNPGSWEPHVGSAGWYTLNLTAQRYYPGYTFPAGMLSTASTVSEHYYINPAANAYAPAYLTTFVPAGLNMRDQAAPSSSTDVALWLDHQGGDQSIADHRGTVRSVQAWASSDGGVTWHAVQVRHVGGNWTAVVPDPASGAVSLRSTVTDTDGSSATTTVYRAYGIG
ncbi:hypothetical protein [Streptacidiphilus neutrinimicus]|uniref:hypothetical protein n=1 Tax=Streptacidiphilus neutrinimicus TaxID=105420 RepID=UPI0005A8F42A|nr:hypothetical protein [Streptacidiphilus neutrinimicus]